MPYKDLEKRRKQNRAYRKAHLEQLAEYLRQWRAEHPRKNAEYVLRYHRAHTEQAAERARRYRAANTEKRAERQRRYRAEHPEMAAESTRRWKQWKQSHPEQVAAHKAVECAIRDGLLTWQPCRVCGRGSTVHGHHEDYSKPLEVVWLCRKHHMARHTELRRLCCVPAPPCCAPVAAIGTEPSPDSRGAILGLPGANGGRV